MKKRKQQSMPNATAFEIITIDIGDRVVCDICGGEWTDRPETGGIYGFGSKAICPDCTPGYLEAAKRHNEARYIKARCPAGKSFADWVRQDLR